MRPVTPHFLRLLRVLRRVALLLLLLLPASDRTLAKAVQETGSETGQQQDRLTAAEVQAAARVLGLEFTEGELEPMVRVLERERASLAQLRVPIDNAVPPALVFHPLVPPLRSRAARPAKDATPRPGPDLGTRTSETLAFAEIEQLSALLRSGEVSCVELTRWALQELERVDAALHCSIQLLPERALAQAALLDAELAEGKDRGPLHGIPWGAKDLLAVAGAPTTWGAEPFRDQVLELDATAVQRLDDAGAVLVAKLTLGALAMGDRWFGERTRNPWDPSRGSSGSSAGSASAVAAGVLPFALGSETLGSIVSPCTRCSVTGLRPTFGRVSRHGAMALSWSMDKVGPIARTARDASLVLKAIAGPDGLDPSVSAEPLIEPRLLSSGPVRIGVPEGAFREGSPWARVLDELRGLGHELVPVTIPEHPVDGILITLMAEAGGAFDELTRSGQDDALTEQGRNAWPNLFRAARFLPAVEYVNAQRQRTLLCRAMDGVFAEVDLLVHPPYAGGLLAITNLTGHPTVVAPIAPEEAGGQPPTVCFTGRLYDEGLLLAVVEAWQVATGHHRLRPPAGDGVAR